MSEETLHGHRQGLDAETPQTDARALPNYIAHLFNALFILLVILPCAYLFWLAFKKSLTWQYSADLPLLLYTGFLMDHFSYIPYRDFFDMNMMGSHLTYSSPWKKSNFTSFFT